MYNIDSLEGGGIAPSTERKINNYSEYGSNTYLDKINTPLKYDTNVLSHRVRETALKGG